MSLDPLSRESNIRDSVKKYLVDSLSTAEGIPLTFDKSLSVPNIPGGSGKAHRWVACVFGSFDLGDLSSQDVDLYCCTRQDSEGFKLAQLRDTVMGYLTDANSSDGHKKITLYRSSATTAWTVLGGMIVLVEPESPEMDTDDGTKFKIIPIRLKWGAKW